MRGQSSIEPWFARFISRLAGTEDKELSQLFADLARGLTTQHSCIELDLYENSDSLRQRLVDLPVVGDGSENTPVVLENNRLFLRRYFNHEVGIASALVELNAPLENIDEAGVGAALDAEFKTPTKQKLAAFQALTRRLTIVAGGPGTGKTTTVAGILRALRRIEDASFTYALAAPTGKAAMRLQSGLGQIDGLPEVKTLHRLLGFRPDSGTWRHNEESPLAADLVIVDEVSMIDLAMMHRLLKALRPNARLLLLGDPGQLPSVEAGNLLADISGQGFPYTASFAETARRVAGVEVEGEARRHLLQDALCELTESHRFSPDRGIGRLSAAVRQGNAPLEQDDEVEALDIDALTDERLESIFHDYIEAVEKKLPAGELLSRFDRLRILVPFRDGDRGVVTLNDRIEAQLARRGLIGNDEAFYHGRPVLVTKNDYTLQLYNGDIGVCITHENDKPIVVFPGNDNNREYLASRLPEHETCFAMTVHKSQGSEFDHVILILPTPDTPLQAQLLTREMFYTAITRARTRLTLFSDEYALNTSLRQHTSRHSGLGERFEVRGSPQQAATEQMDLF